MRIAITSTGETLESEVDPRVWKVCILYNC